MHASLAAAVRSFVVDNYLYGKASAALADRDSFQELGVIDSTGILELVTFIEEKYGIKLEDEEILPENLDTIEKVAAFVAGKLEKRSEPRASASLS